MSPKGVKPRNASSTKSAFIDLPNTTTDIVEDAKVAVIDEGHIDRWALNNHWELYAVEPPRVTELKTYISETFDQQEDGFPVYIDGEEFKMGIKKSNTEDKIVDWLLQNFIHHGVTSVHTLQASESALHAMSRNQSVSLQKLIDSNNTNSEDIIQAVTSTKNTLDEYKRLENLFDSEER